MEKPKLEPKRKRIEAVVNRERVHPHCVICQNEGPHGLDDRPHVMEGQE